MEGPGSIGDLMATWVDEPTASIWTYLCLLVRNTESECLACKKNKNKKCTKFLSNLHKKKQNCIELYSTDALYYFFPLLTKIITELNEPRTKP